MAEHNELGIRGEKLAIAYLQKNGYRILDTNWRFQKAELDIVAVKDDILHVIEVKTRTSDYFGNPSDFVTKKKIKMSVEAANAYCEQKNIHWEVQFDIISVILNQKEEKLEHIQRAFLWF